MDRFTSLNTFVEAAEARSFTVAGRKLGISSSAVGKAIARLEERLGVRLFHRSTRSIALTPEGELFLMRCQRILGEVEAAEMELADNAGTPRGRLKISLPLIGMLLMPAIGGFAEAYPEIELDLDFSDRLVDVVEEGFDAVMRTGSATDSQLMTRTLGNYSYLIVGSPAYFTRRGNPQEPEDLLGHACLHHRWTMTGKLERWMLSRDGVDLTLDLPVTATANTMEPLIDLVERGLGLAYVPMFTVRRKIEQGLLATTLDRFTRQVGTFQILWPSGRQRAPKIKALVDYMARHLIVGTADGA
ncbi:MAG: LysR family transcriptional regulator [Janthinobacterium lividum]